MPRRKEKRKDEEDSATDPEPVPESPPKRAKKAMPPPAATVPNMTLSSTSTRRVIERSHWPGPPPRLPSGSYQLIQEAKRKEEERKKRKGKGEAKDEDEVEEDQEEDKEKKDAHPAIAKHQAADGQRAPAHSTVSSVESINRSLQAKKDSETKRDLSKPIINTPYQIELTQSTYLKFQSTREHIYRGSMEITPSSRLRENSLRYFLFSRDRDDGSYRDLANITALINAYKIGWLEWRDDGKVTYWYKGKRLTEPREYDPEEHKRHADNKEEPRALWVEGLSLPFYVRLCL